MEDAFGHPVSPSTDNSGMARLWRQRAEADEIARQWDDFFRPFGIDRQNNLLPSDKAA